MTTLNTHHQTDTGPQADSDQILAFLNQSIPEQIHLVAIQPEGKAEGRFFGTDSETAADWAASKNAGGMNVYFSPHYVREGFNGVANKDDIVAARLICIDIDPPKDGQGWDKAAAVKQLTQAQPTPTAIVNSGNGLQAHFRVEDNTALDICEKIARAAIAQFGGDHGTHNYNRVMRLPGTVNWPDRRKRARGSEPSMAKVVLDDDGSVYRAEELIQAFPTINTVARHRPRVEIGAYEPITAEDLGLPRNSYLRQLIENPSNVDRSSDVYACACQAFREGYSKEQVAGILGNPLNAISAHIQDQADSERAIMRVISSALTEDDIQRVQAGNLLNALVPSSVTRTPSAYVTSLPDMLDRFVFVKEGSQVADLLNPASITQLKDFRNATAASKTRIATGEGISRPVLTANAWLESKQRLSTDTVTFRPGMGRFTEDPKGRPAFNTWTPYHRNCPPADWQTRVQPFLDHVQWLWKDSPDQFLDWLAHIEQLPGTLPHSGWLHIATNQGLGRNWISNVLQKVWHQGHVATSFDLEAALQGGFNGGLGGKILAVVDEICAGGTKEARKSAQVLKRLVTEETRLINPKYGHQYTEFNACRWLIFSNSPHALPLEDSDRRFWVEECTEVARDRAYYARLYGLLEDPLFIRSVARFLATRDLSLFDRGAIPPLNKAKEKLLERSRSDAENELHDLIRGWPDRLITSVEIAAGVTSGGLYGPALHYAASRTKLEKVGSYRVDDGFGRRAKVTVYAIKEAQAFEEMAAAELRCLIEAPARKTAIEHFLENG